MIYSFEQKIDDLRFQYESGVTETITKSLEKKNTEYSATSNSYKFNTQNMLNKIENLQQLELFLKNYEGLEIKNTCRNTVFSDGSCDSEIMLIGEAPGNQEDIEGKPFVGKSGKLLDKILKIINLDRNNCYITNLIPWKPPGNRNPTNDEIELCLPIIKKHIQLINPKILMLIGSISTRAILGKDQGITKLRGQWHIYKDLKIDIPALPIFHPAYLLRRPANKSLVMKDMLSFYQKIRDNRII